MINIVDEGRVRTITINRPDKANALTEQMLIDLRVAFENADANVIVLTGAGKVFSAGADLEAARAGLATSPEWEKLSGVIAASPAMTIAALNGTVAGGAFGMVLACDLRIAVPSAKFFYPVMKLGFLPQPSDPKRMAALTGPAAAKRILMAGDKMLAQEALRVGLIDYVCDPDDLHEKLREICGGATMADTLHVAGIKALF